MSNKMTDSVSLLISIKYVATQKTHLSWGFPSWDYVAVAFVRNNTIQEVMRRSFSCQSHVLGSCQCSDGLQWDNSQNIIVSAGRIAVIWYGQFTETAIDIIIKRSHKEDDIRSRRSSHYKLCLWTKVIFLLMMCSLLLVYYQSTCDRSILIGRN